MDLEPAHRDSAEAVLNASFQGLYKTHARKTLQEADVVRAAKVGEDVVGVAMLKDLGRGAGYVYYVAVEPAHRRKGIGRRLLADALDYFARRGSQHVYASIEEENVESRGLFQLAGFRRIGLGKMSERYGVLRALDMYRKMLVVPGEALFCLELGTAAPGSDGPSQS